MVVVETGRASSSLLPHTNLSNHLEGILLLFNALKSHHPQMSEVMIRIRVIPNRFLKTQMHSEHSEFVFLRNMKSITHDHLIWPDSMCFSNSLKRWPGSLTAVPDQHREPCISHVFLTASPVLYIDPHPLATTLLMDSRLKRTSHPPSNTQNEECLLKSLTVWN